MSRQENHGKKDEEVNEENEAEIRKRYRKSKKRVDEDKLRKLFSSTVDLYEVPLKWWETEHVRYGLSYEPVNSRLIKLMGCFVVRLTDRKYMELLASRIKEDHEKRQQERMEKRKLKPLPLIPELPLEFFEKFLDKSRGRIKSTRQSVDCKRMSNLLFREDDKIIEPSLTFKQTEQLNEFRF